MTFKEKIKKEYIDRNVAIDLVGGSSSKGKIIAIEDDFVIVKTSGVGEVYVVIDKITKIWETL